MTGTGLFDTRAFDLPAYLARIGYEGAAAPDLATLRAITVKHPIAIPFENLDPFFARPVALDTVSLQEKIVRNGRGGYCFEHNLLLGTALTAIGFDVAGLAARVLWNVPEGAVTPRGHMLLLLQIDGQPHLADAGFGGLTLTGPLRLDAGVSQETPHETFRLVGDGGDFVMQASVRGEWRPLYRFDLQRQALADYEVTSWYLSNHPRSHFVTGLIAARAERDRRYALRNGELAVHHRSGDTERRLLLGAEDLRDTLQDVFRIRVPESADFGEAFGRTAQAARCR
jgi:N-hydroxyarylamine O-acetyltransferase